MCGRFANHLGAMHGWSDVLQDWPLQGQLGFNIAPTQMVPIVTYGGCQIYRWGLVPNWVKQADPGFSTFNARLDTLAQKPSFKHAWLAQQRCIVPVLGYYEWRQENQSKQAFFVRRKDANPILLGGLFEPGRHELPGSFTIITRPAEGILAQLHHAMPLMFDKTQGKQWLQPDFASAENICRLPYPPDYHYYPVSNRVNKASNQGPQLIEPIDPPEMKQQGFEF